MKIIITENSIQWEPLAAPAGMTERESIDAQTAEVLTFAHRRVCELMQIYLAAQAARFQAQRECDAARMAGAGLH